MQSAANRDALSLNFTSFYQCHYKVVRTIVYRHGFRDAALEDLVQDIFIKAWQALPNLDAISAISSWLMSIARNHSLNEVRKVRQARCLVSVDAVRGDSSQSFHDVLEAPDLLASFELEQTMHCLDQLILSHNDKARGQVARMFYLEHKSVREISEATGINQNTVLSHLRRFRLIAGQAMLRLAKEKGLEYGS